LGKLKKLIQDRSADAFIFIIILVFFILTLAAILIEYFRMESLHQQVEYSLQRGINSAVEYAMRDEYRMDSYARMDTEASKEAFYKYLHENMALDGELNKYTGGQWAYQLEIESINATEIPPRLELEGVLKTRSIFGFLTGDVRLRFYLASKNTRIEEGGT